MLNLTTRTFSIEKRRRCTMICVTILFCYLFTCCTHLNQLTLAASSSSSSQQQQQQQQHHQQQGTLNPRSDHSSGETLNLHPNNFDAILQPNGEIMMKVSIFGKMFHLRLKRNADFQQRIKEMKMFIAESTGDGQLRYTEIKNHHHPSNNNNNSQQQQQQQQQHKQEPHKRAAVNSTTSTTSDANAENAANIRPPAPSVSSPSSPSSSSSEDSNNINNNRPASSTPSTATTTTTTGNAKETLATDSKKKKKLEEATKQRDHISSSSAANVWNIGSTYHDEDNLAALLIDHDRETGHLQVHGTIGNDFVIKPMPQATLDALVLRQQQELLRNQQQQVEQLDAKASIKPQPVKAASSSSSNQSTGNNVAVPGEPSSGQLQTAADQERPAKSGSPIDVADEKAGGANKQVLANNNNIKLAPSSKNGPASLESAMHMHDDDPHDDDEMFLDEDEAIELAHLQSSASIEFNHNNAASNASLSDHDSYSQQVSALAAHNQSLPQQQQQPRALSKAASERKLKKYRKLMAQTQVPKPSALTAQNEQPRDPLAASSSQQQQQQQQQQQEQVRARRHAHHASIEDAAHSPRQVQVSHHIVYRQKPSSEGSSSEHQHSFMISPGLFSSSAASMEQMALNFSPQRLIKRSIGATETANGNEQIDENDADENDDNMIDHQLSGAERLARLRSATSGADLDGGTDFAHDPLGGQFYLEPGSVTGVERAGFSDWSLLSSSSGRRSRLAPPPYALNGSDESAYYSQQQLGQNNNFDRLNNDNMNDTSNANHHSHNLTAQETTKRRFKRQTRLAPGQVRRKRQAPDTVWPEVLLVVDYDSFLLHGGDSRDVKRYFVSFWNGVDLRYKLLVHPHIRISLAGMIVAKDRDATPYLERNRLRAPNADAVDAAGALTDMGKYLYREDRLPTYDLAVVITKLDMCRRRYEGGRCNRGTAGFAYVGGACVVNKRLEKVNSVAIIEDSGGFSGIIVAAHEVGHLLGCVHDGSPPPSYLGGPGATHCPWEDGFIMSDLRHTERGFRWSQCSVEQFKHFLNGETATCLYNYPHESQMLHRLLPGTMLTLDEQCKRDRGTNACFKDARVCAQLFCFDSASGYCVSYRPAAEGSPCGEAQVCRNGKCVGEIENIIPDYTHQTQTVVARRPHSVTGRLADNGLSASSTSTATSSPDSKFSPGTGNAVNPANQLISRMDTFPVDTPLNGPSSVSYPVTGNTNYLFGGRHSSGSVSIEDGSPPVSSGLMLMRQQTGISTTVPASGSPMHYTTLKSGKLVADSHHSSNKQQDGYQQRSGHQAILKGANQGVVKQYYNQHNQQHQNNNHHPQSPNGLYTSASTMSHQYPSSSPSGNNLLTSVSTNPVTLSKKQQQQQQLFDNQRIMYQQQIIKHSESHSDINNNQPQQQHRVNRNHVNVNHPVYQNRQSTSTSSSRLHNPLSQPITVTS